MSEVGAHDKRLILLVEDDNFLRDIFARKLEGNFDFLVTDNAAEALSLANEKKPDIVLLDLNLPDGNGFDILKKIRENTELENTLVLILTNSVMSEDVMTSNKLKADDFLTKANFSMDEIIDRMEKHLNKKALANG